jgi:hypothetical protein
MAARIPLFRLGLLTLLVGLTLPGLAEAQDIFIRPGQATTPAPQKPAIDYGIKPLAPSQQPQRPAQQQPQPQVQQPAQVQQPQYQQPAQQQYAQPTQQPTYQPPPPPSSSDTGIEQIGSNVTLVKVPVDGPPDPGNGPNVLQISLKPGMIGGHDKLQVMQALGINEGELQSNCYFRYSTLLTYGEGGGTMLNSGGAASVTHHFTGPLRKVEIYPSVTCKKLRNPSSGVIMEQGGMFVVSLGSVKCDPARVAAAPSIGLGFRYAGDGQGECAYQ